MFFIFAFLLFIAIVGIAYNLFSRPKSGYRKAAVAPEVKEKVRIEKKKASFLEKIHPLLQKMSAFNANLKFDLVKKMRRRLEEKLRKAGNPGNLNADEFLALQELFAIGISLLGCLIFGSFSLIYLVLFGGIGFYLPMMRLNDGIKKRQKVILKSLPDILDLLTLCVEAGLDFSAGVVRVIEKSKPGPIVDEFFQMLQEMKMGRTRRESLKSMGERVDQPDFSSFVSAVVLAGQLGTSLAPILRIQCEQLRIRRIQLAEKIAMQAPIKMLFPLLGFIFPAVFIMLFGPIILSAMR